MLVYQRVDDVTSWQKMMKNAATSRKMMGNGCEKCCQTAHIQRKQEEDK